MVDISQIEDGAEAPWQRVTLPRWRFRFDLIIGVLVFQLVCALFFLGEMWSEVFGLRSTPIPWQYQEIIQIMASVGLITGVIASFVALRRNRQSMAHMGRQIDVASGRFEEHLQQMFADWQLSPSEQDVTIYAMKGFSNAEIAELRGTSTATAKSQMNAIYRKTGLANRQQLISCLVEDLLSGVGARGDVPAGPQERDREAA